MILVVGAGFAGSVVARELADNGYAVKVIDKRNHIAGNAFDQLDSNGVMVHEYGPHIFHTNAKRIFDYLSRFTEWRTYEHKVLSVVNGVSYPFPINRDTINKMYGLNLDEAGVASFLESVREERNPALTSEDVVLNSVGRELYEAFFYNYTVKQWGMLPNELKAGVAARIPIRTNQDDRYFTDTYQGIPSDGYTFMFANMLAHPNISVELNTEFDPETVEQYAHIVYTGPIDAYFGFRHGRLPYRSLEFVHEHHDKSKFQEVGTVNYPNDHKYTRITEFKHLTGQECSGTSIVYEFPVPYTQGNEPYYPIPSETSEALFQKYSSLAKSTTGVTFVGRLAQYRYYNMDQVVGAALTAASSIIGS